MSRFKPPPPEEEEDRGESPFSPTRNPHADYMGDFAAFYERDERTATGKDAARLAFTEGIRASNNRLLWKIKQEWEKEKDPAMRALLVRMSGIVART